jgi:hypothetical protein
VFVELGGIAMGLRLVHDASLEEIRERFGQFHGSDRRVQLFAVLEKFAADAKSAALVQAMIVNGSFTTDKVRPSDIDLILVLREHIDLSRDLLPRQYNLVSPKRVKARHGFDVLYATDSPESLDPLVEFFSQVRGQPELRKGMVRVTL